MSDQPAAGAPVFALTPVQAHAGNAIDYTASAGVKVYNAATA